jgi:hypothetical protein
MWDHLAAHAGYQALGATEEIFTDPTDMHVHGFLVCNSTLAPTIIVIRDVDGVELFRYTVPASETNKFEASFLVDNGLAMEDLSGAGGTSVTVFYCGERLER